MKTANDEDPITDLRVISTLSRCPDNYYPIAKTADTKEEADLWHDGFFSKKTQRYICISKKQQHSSGRPADVLISIVIINDLEIVPEGHMVVDMTADTNEKALKKRQLCVRLSPRVVASSAITDVLILGRSKRPPPGYSVIVEMNNLLLCYKLTKINPLSLSTLGELTCAASETGNLGSNAVLSGSFRVAPAPPIPPRPPVPAVGLTSRSSGVGTTAEAQKQTHPLSGVPFAFNKKLSATGSDGASYGTSNGPMAVPDIPFKSTAQIDSEYYYNFSNENSVLQQC